MRVSGRGAERHANANPINIPGMLSPLLMAGAMG